MITDGLSYVSVLVFFASVILAAERVTGWAVFRFVPGVVFLYIGSMLLATLGVWSMAATKPVYRELSALLTYAMIFTMLLRSDDARCTLRLMDRRLRQYHGDSDRAAHIGGAASAPILASLYSGALIPVGIFLAILGHIIGTPLGLWIARLLEMLA